MSSSEFPEEEPSGSPKIDYYEVDEDEVLDFIENEEIGVASHYGFSCAEEMIDFILGKNGYSGIFNKEIDALLEAEERDRDEVLRKNYDFSADAWYKPGNSNCYLRMI